ncbi:UNVERIFIED_CONTAM: hypothetical protein K2H54_007545 [Gekko kuhli]
MLTAPTSGRPCCVPSRRLGGLRLPRHPASRLSVAVGPLSSFFARIFRLGFGCSPWGEGTPAVAHPATEGRALILLPCPDRELASAARVGCGAEGAGGQAAVHWRPALPGTGDVASLRSALAWESRTPLGPHLQWTLRIP